MSLLDDFETLERRQVDSIDYFLMQLVIQDRYPIEMNLDEFSRVYFEHFDTIGWLDRDRPLYNKSTLYDGRVYIASGIDGHNVSQYASERIYVIGCLETGFRKITREELQKYLDMFAKQWPDSELRVGFGQPQEYSYYYPHSIENIDRGHRYIDIAEWKVNNYDVI